MKKAVKILCIASLALSIISAIVGFLVRIPIVQAGTAIYSVVVGVLMIVMSIKKKPSIVIGVLSILDLVPCFLWILVPLPFAQLSGALMIVAAVLNKKIAAKEAAEAVAEEYVEEEYIEYAEEENVEYAE